MFTPKICIPLKNFDLNSTPHPIPKLKALASTGEGKRGHLPPPLGRPK